MRNLITFVLRYQGVMLFVLLEVVGLYLYVTNGTYQRAAFFNSANAYAGAVLARRTQVADYFRLDELNRQLLTENARLRQQLFPPDHARREADSLPVGRDTLGRIVYRHLRPYPAGLAQATAGAAATAPARADRYPDTLLLGGARLATRQLDYPLVPARVINNSLRSVDNYLTLNVGEADGVQPGMAVLAAAGVVGRVKAVSAHFATVRSLLHSKAEVAAALKRDNTDGVVKWDGNDYRYVQLDDVQRQNRLVDGDTVVTSGHNAVFPPGVFIGTVASHVKESDKNFWTVQVRLGVDFSHLAYVYVVPSRNRFERDSLEAAPDYGPYNAAPPVMRSQPARSARSAAPASRPAGTPAPAAGQTGASLGRPDLTARAAAALVAGQQTEAARAAKARAAAERAAKAKAAQAKAASPAATPPAPATPNPQQP